MNAETKTVTTYVEAYACDEHGDGPLFAKVEADQAFLDRITRLQKIVKEHHLSEVRQYSGDHEWEAGDVADDLRLVNDELVVCHDAFWFVADVKHADYHVETRAQDIETFIKSILAHEGDEPMYFGNDIKELQDMVEDDLVDEESATAA